MKKTTRRNSYLFAAGIIFVALSVLFIFWMVRRHEANRALPPVASQPIKTDQNVAQPGSDSSAVKIEAPVPTNQASTSNVPILMYHHIRTNNDPSNQIEQGLDVPADQFDLQMKSLADHGYQSVPLNNVFGQHDFKEVVLSFDDGYKDIVSNALPILEKYHFKGVAFIITSYVGRDDFMTWDDIRTLQKAGWEIGSHTLDHPDLPKATEVKARKEIFESKQALETQLGISVISFCYPSGKFNDSVVKLVNEAGYKYAVTTTGGKTNLLSDKLVLKRVRINGPDSLKSFENKIY